MARLECLFATVLFLFVLVRGLALSTALMPFEGWDEYQHLGVASFVHDHGRMPTPKDKLPRDMWTFVRTHPHPASSARQLQGLDVRNYGGKVFRDGQWVAPEKTDPGPDAPLAPGLYQAQHGPLYYHILAAMRPWFSSFGAWADAARILNVLLAASVSVLWFMILQRRFGNGPLRFIPCAAAMVWATNSLFMYDAARAANDMLAIFFGTLALLVYFTALRPGPRSTPAACALAGTTGLLIGLGVTAKASVLVLVPLLCAGIFLSARKYPKRLRAVLPAGVLLLAYLATAGSYHLECLRTLGTFTGMQEAVHNTAEGRTASDIIRAALSLDPGLYLQKFLVDYLHVGGWSFLPKPPCPTRFFVYLVQASAGLYLLALIRPSTLKTLLHQAMQSWELGLVLVLTWLGLIYHAAHSLIYWGEVYTNAWYGMLSFPVLVAFLILGSCVVSRWIGAALALGYAAVFSWAYYLGTYVEMLRHETGGLAFMEALREVQTHHVLLDGWLPVLLAAEGVLLVALACLTVARALSGRWPPPYARP